MKKFSSVIKKFTFIKKRVLRHYRKEGTKSHFT